MTLNPSIEKASVTLAFFVLRYRINLARLGRVRKGCAK